MSSEYKNAARIEANIERTRAEMDETLDALQEKFSPGKLIDQALSYFNSQDGNGNEFVDNLNQTIKQNPIPTALVGIGLGWLMLSGKEQSSYQSYAAGTNTRYSSANSDSGSLQDKATALKKTAQEKTSALKDQAQAKLDTVSDHLSEAGDSAQQRLNQGLEQARGSYEYVMREQPLVLVGMGLALGAALGAGLPPTRKEDELLGETRDRLKDQAIASGGEQLEKVKSVANKAKQAAQEKAQEEGLDAEAGFAKLDQVETEAKQAAESAKDVAKATKDAALKEAENQGLASSESGQKKRSN